MPSDLDQTTELLDFALKLLDHVKHIRLSREVCMVTPKLLPLVDLSSHLLFRQRTKQQRIGSWWFKSKRNFSISKDKRYRIGVIFHWNKFREFRVFIEFAKLNSTKGVWHTRKMAAEGRIRENLYQQIKNLNKFEILYQQNKTPIRYIGEEVVVPYSRFL